MSPKEHQKPRIALIDDEEMILTSLYALFSMETDYEILRFDDPLTAVKTLEHQPVDLVISDYLMPGLSGIDLLNAIKEVQPEAQRILLTGFADKQNAIRGINEVGLYQYIEKPWDNQQLLLVVRNALRQENLRRQLAEKISALDRLLREHDELSRQQVRLEQELEMAAAIQQSLLPQQAPIVDGYQFHSVYRPTQMLGGDYYDAVHCGNNSITIVSDVSGHGVAAALTSMLLKSIFQESAMTAADPVDLLMQMNSKLHRFLPDTMYVAAAILWIAPTGILLANAGLPYPWILRSSEPKSYAVPLTGVPLGLLKGRGREDFDVRGLDLAHGDILLLASDGLGDVTSRDDEYFMDSEMPKVLSELQGRNGSQVIGALLDRATQFSKGRPFPDDVTLLSITRL